VGVSQLENCLGKCIVTAAVEATTKDYVISLNEVKLVKLFK